MHPNVSFEFPTKMFLKKDNMSICFKMVMLNSLKPFISLVIVRKEKGEEEEEETRTRIEMILF